MLFLEVIQIIRDTLGGRVLRSVTQTFLTFKNTILVLLEVKSSVRRLVFASKSTFFLIKITVRSKLDIKISFQIERIVTRGRGSKKGKKVSRIIRMALITFQWSLDFCILFWNLHLNKILSCIMKMMNYDNNCNSVVIEIIQIIRDTQEGKVGHVNFHYVFKLW